LSEQEFRLQQQTVAIPSSQPEAASHWPAFAADLAKALSTLTSGQYLILEHTDQKGYVQFASRGDDGLRAETVSNAYLPVDIQLDPAQLATLTALSWRPPIHQPEAPASMRQPAGSVNHYAHFEVPLRLDAIVALAVRTSAEIFNVVDASQLRYRAFNKRGGELSISAVGLPQLPATIASNGNSNGPSELNQKAVGGPAAPGHTRQSAAVAAMKESLLGVMRAICEKSEVEFDSDGDVGIWIGGQLIFVRALMPGPWGRNWTHILGAVEDSPGLLPRLNELNATRGMRLRFHTGSIYAEHEIPADPLFKAVLVQSLVQFSVAIAGLGATLQQELGGRLWPEGIPLGPTAH
jgi:hypothetical protein